MSDPNASVSLLARAVSALQDSGRLVKTNWELDNFDVVAETDGAEPTLGVVMNSLQAVVFYQVWPQAVPEPRRADIHEYTTRANTELYTSAFEFDLDTGFLMLRAGVQFADGQQHAGDVDRFDRDTFTRLLLLALDEVESGAQLHGPGVAAVLAGSGVLDALAQAQ